MKIPKVAYMFWHGREFTYLHYLTVDSFLFHNPDMELILYTVPASAPHSWITKEQSPRIASDIDYFARLQNIKIVEIEDPDLVRYPPNIICDMLRWQKLHEHGGYWIDTDILFLKPLHTILDALHLNGDREEVEFVGSIYKQKKQWSTYFPIGIIGGAPGNKVCEEAMTRVCYDPKVYNGCGPDLLRKILRSFDHAMSYFADIGFFDPSLLYPYQCYELDRLFGMNNGVSSNTVGIHWFFGSPLARTYINHWQACMESATYCLTDCTMDTAIVKYYHMRYYKIIVCVIDSYGWAHNIFAQTIRKSLPMETLFFICTPAEVKKTNIQHDTIDLFLLLHSYDSLTLPREKTVHWVCDYSTWIHHPNPQVQQRMRDALRKTMKNAAMTLISCKRIEEYMHEADLPVKRVMHFPYIPEDFVVVPYSPTIYTKPVLVVGWLGNSSPSCHGWLKGLEVIKRVCARHPEKFVLRYHNKWEKNDIPYSQVGDFYRDIDIYVCFSLYEGSPNTIMEASACGRAWISTDVGEVDQLIGYDAGCGIVIERREDVLEERLMYLHEHREMIMDMGERAGRVIERYYSMDVLGRNVEKILDMLCSSTQ